MRQAWRILAAALIALVCGFIGFQLVNGAARSEPRPPRPAPAKPVRSPRNEVARPTKTVERDEFPDGTTVEVSATLVPQELILRFPSDDSYGSFLAALGASPVERVAQLDRLRAVRIHYQREEDLSELLEGENLTAIQELSRLPASSRPGGGVRQEAVAFGDHLMSWLGAEVDRSHWGEGVKVAVIDTGAVANAALPAGFSSLEFVPFPADRTATHFHGTAVASLIVGRGPRAQGLAPAAQLLSIRTADESGRSDSFWMAAGILAAMDAGVDLINLSMGSTGEMPLISQAVQMAQEAGIVIVASAGNEGEGESRFPAACPGVIAVGAVDANGQRMAFSNLSNTLTLVAPGYGLLAASPDGRLLQMSGTSAAAPLVTAAIAATMSDGRNRRLSAQEALQIVLAQTDEAGYPGPDTEFGRGILNVGRIMHRDRRGIADAAITDQRIVADRGGEVQVTVQNRGTDPLINTLVQVTTPAGATPVNLTSLAPGAIQTVKVPFALAALSEGANVEIRTTVSLGNGDVDTTPDNNVRIQGFRKR